jgi:hypothetical protein
MHEGEVSALPGACAVDNHPRAALSALFGAKVEQRGLLPIPVVPPSSMHADFRFE